MTLTIDTPLYENLKALSEIFDTPLPEILSDSIKKSYSMFTDQDGNIRVKKAIYTYNKEKKECYYVRDRLMFGCEYRTIVIDKKVLNVPKKLVEIVE